MFAMCSLLIFRYCQYLWIVFDQSSLKCLYIGMLTKTHQRKWESSDMVLQDLEKGSPISGILEQDGWFRDQ